MLRIKVKSSEGDKVVNVEQNSTFESLLVQLGLNEATFKTGFPVRSLQFTKDNLVKDFLRNGDSVLLENAVKNQSNEMREVVMPGYPKRGTVIKNEAIQTLEGILTVRPIPDDNSCCPKY